MTSHTYRLQKSLGVSFRSLPLSDQPSPDEMLTFSYFLVWFLAANQLVITESSRSLPQNRVDYVAKEEAAKVDYWIEQKLNNFDALDGRKWKQRYLKSDAFYRPDGPAILYVGGETRFSHFHLQSTDLLIRMAREVGAMLFYLEHRFYGELKPTSDSGTENLRYLSSRQALEDLAVFIHNATSTSDVRLSKWILFGASYAGSLAVWARMKFPHLVYAVVAASPPLKAKLFFDEYMQSVNETLYRYGGDMCHNAIRVANQEITEMMKSAAGRKQLLKFFNLCAYPETSQNSMSVFHSLINSHVENIVQFSKGNILFKTPGTVYLTIREMCDIMTNTSTRFAVERFAHLVSVRRNSTFCINTNFEEYVQTMRNETWGQQSQNRAWLYQTCTEFGWFQVVTGDPFQPVPESFPKELCKELFAPALQEGVVVTAPKLTNIDYGSTQIATILTRTVVSNGGVDPWHEMSYYKSNVRLETDSEQIFSSTTVDKDFEDPYGFNSIFVDSSSHAEIVRWEEKDDSIELRNARNAVIALVRLWLTHEQT